MRLLIIFSIFLLFSCHKDKPATICSPIDPCVGSYLNYSTGDFDAIKEDFWRPCVVGPFATYPESYRSLNGVFNPNNSNEIIYNLIYTVDININKELWKFNFCTGEKLLLADNCYGQIDWSPKGWILYQGTGLQLYKVKDNGDSLSIVSPVSGINNSRYWNPSGTLFCASTDHSYFICDIQGDILKEIPNGDFAIYNWYSDDELLVRKNNKIFSLKLDGMNYTELNSIELPIGMSSFMTIDHNTKVAYVQKLQKWYKYYLDGFNMIDSLKDSTFGTYHVHGLDFSSDKILSTLTRQEWKDSTGCEYWARQNLMLMDKDGSNHRLIEIP